MSALTEPFRHDTMIALAIVAAAAALTALLILWLKPFMARYALARPNARSSHNTPTPQGAGIAIVATWILITCAALTLAGAWPAHLATNLLVVFAATVLMAGLGAIDDIRPIAVVPRLLVQFAGVASVIAILPADFQMTPFLPWWLERALLVLAGSGS